MPTRKTQKRAPPPLALAGSLGGCHAAPMQDERQRINLNHLRYFYAVAKSANMRQAAKELGISQPALSKQIQALEDAVGLQLFYRTSRGLRVTQEGAMVLGHCEPLFGHLRDLEQALEQRRQGTSGRLVVGAVPSMSAHFLAKNLARYREAFPEVRVRVVTHRSRGVLRALRQHHVDLGLVTGQPKGEDLIWNPIFRTSLVPVVAPTHPLASSAPGSPQKLHAQPMVAFDAAAPTRLVSERYLARWEIQPCVVAECPSIDSIVALVMEGLGFAILPYHYIASHLAHGFLAPVPLEGWKLSRQIYLVHLAGPPLAPTVRHFVELLGQEDPPQKTQVDHA